MRRLALILYALAGLLVVGVASANRSSDVITCDNRGCGQKLPTEAGLDLYTPYNWQTQPFVPAATRVHHDWRHRNTLQHPFSKKHATSSLASLITPLADKVREIENACGSKVVSGYRPGARVAGSGHPSLHSLWPSRAADLAGNPTCIYAHLTSWAGGYSTDYGNVRHVHMSYSPPGSGALAGREWHARFQHYSGGHHTRRYARHYHHKRYASR